MSRAFAIPATDDAGFARRVASGVEELGFSAIWSNDTPAADGIWTAAQMADATEQITVGVGVVAADRRPPSLIVAAIRELQIPLDRLVIGVGSGRSSAPLATVRNAVAELRQSLGPEARVAVAAMGPQMCRLAAEVADTVLLNWMVPERIRWAAQKVSDGARRAGRPEPPRLAAYVRAALGPGARERVGREAHKYNHSPAYSRHFRAMGVPLDSVGLAEHDGAGFAPLVDYDKVLDEVVIRALPETGTVASTLAVAARSAPGN